MYKLIRGIETLELLDKARIPTASKYGSERRGVGATAVDLVVVAGLAVATAYTTGSVLLRILINLACSSARLMLLGNTSSVRAKFR